MLASNLVSALALAGSVLATGDLGFNLGVTDNDGNCKTTLEFEEELEWLSGYTKLVKTYAVLDCNTLENLGPALESKGFQVVLGVWPTDSAHFTAEQNALKTYLPTISKLVIKLVTVGLEALYRDDMTAQELADCISTIKLLLLTLKDKDGNLYLDVLVGTVDLWNVLVDGASTPAIKEADFVYANAFLYWQGQTMANALYSFFDDIMQALKAIQTIKGSTDIEFYVGETGWATGGSNYGSSVPLTKNAAQFWKEGICSMRKWGVNVCVFEAFDELWKPVEKDNDVERYWGVFGTDGTPKYDLSC